MAPDFEILILGPLEIRREGVAAPVGGYGAKAVLCALLIGVNHSVPVEQLTATAWGEDRPDSAETQIQTHVYRLRGLLGPDSIVRTDDGYELIARCEQIDSCRFERMVAAAEAELEANSDRARTLAREALGLWRGPPFGELGSEPFAELEAIRLHDLRLDAVEFEIAAELRTSREREAVARLQALTQEYPLREKFWQLLVRGLAAVDRRPEAVDAFQLYCDQLRTRGLEPQVDLEDLLSG